MSWGPTYNEQERYNGKLLVANEHDIIAVNDFAKKSAGYNQFFTQSKLIVSHLAAPSGIFTFRGRSYGKVIFSRMSLWTGGTSHITITHALDLNTQGPLVVAW